MAKDYNDHNVLLNSLKEHDFDAFNFLYASFRKRMFSLAYLLLQDEEDSKDLVQDFFVDFWQTRMYEKINSHLTTYIMHAFRNRAISLKKKMDYVQKLKEASLSPLHSHMSYPIENEELKKELDAAIKNLPPMAAKVFSLHYIEQLSYYEISQQLGISESTVGNHINRALKGLRSDLKKNYKNSNID